MKKPLTYEQMKQETLTDFETALLYLREAIKGNDATHFLDALADVIKAQGGVKQFASKVHVSRQTIYNIYEHKGVRSENLFQLVDGLGLSFDLVPKKAITRHQIRKSRAVLMAA